MALMDPSSYHRAKKSLQSHGQTGQEQRPLMPGSCRITQLGRDPQEVSKRCRTSPRCALKTRSALCSIPDAKEGNVGGGIAPHSSADHPHPRGTSGAGFGVQLFGSIASSLLFLEMGRKGGNVQEQELAGSTNPSVLPMSPSSPSHLLSQPPQCHRGV